MQERHPYGSGVVIVGASLAGFRTATALREHGYNSRIRLIGAEPHLPYDRPALSKDYLTGEGVVAPPQYASSREMAELNVEAMLGVQVTALNTERSSIVANGQELAYDKLVIATGVSPRRLDGLTRNLHGVHYLRTVEDAADLKDALAGRRRVTIIGGGFIGGEVASSVRSMGHDVTIIDQAVHPYQRSGQSFSEWMVNVHRQRGVVVHTGTGVHRVLGNTAVEAVELENGTTVATDVLLIAVGCVPNTGWLSTSALNIENGVLCDQYLNAAPNVFAVGDIARWPNALFGAQATRVEHWTNAVEQARYVAKGIARGHQQSPFRGIPYFWSHQHGHHIQGLGRMDGSIVRLRTAGPSHLPSPGAVGARVIYLSGEDGAIRGALSVDAPADLIPLRQRIAKQDELEDVVASLIDRGYRVVEDPESASHVSAHEVVTS